MWLQGQPLRNIRTGKVAELYSENISKNSITLITKEGKKFIGRLNEWTHVEDPMGSPFDGSLEEAEKLINMTKEDEEEYFKGLKEIFLKEKLKDIDRRGCLSGLNTVSVNVFSMNRRHRNIFWGHLLKNAFTNIRLFYFKTPKYEGDKRCPVWIAERNGKTYKIDRSDQAEIVKEIQIKY